MTIVAAVLLDVIIEFVAMLAAAPSGCAIKSRVSDEVINNPTFFVVVVFFFANVFSFIVAS